MARVQHLAGGGDGAARGAAVDGVAHDGQAQVGEVQADLVLASRLQLDLEQRPRREALDDAPARARVVGGLARPGQPPPARLVDVVDGRVDLRPRPRAARLRRGRRSGAPSDARGRGRAARTAPAGRARRRGRPRCRGRGGARLRRRDVAGAGGRRTPARAPGRCPRRCASGEVGTASRPAGLSTTRTSSSSWRRGRDERTRDRALRFGSQAMGVVGATRRPASRTVRPSTVTWPFSITSRALRRDSSGWAWIRARSRRIRTGDQSSPRARPRPRGPGEVVAQDRVDLAVALAQVQRAARRTSPRPRPGTRPGSPPP